MKVIASGDARDGGTEADLAATIDFDGFDEAASTVSVYFQVIRE